MAPHMDSRISDMAATSGQILAGKQHLSWLHKPPLTYRYRVSFL